jgi:hypothetical protein
MFGDYPRAHLTRVVSVYSTGRSEFRISYPNDPAALALPLDIGRSIRGEEVSRSTFQSYPVPTLAEFRVQPRSMSMFRAEQMLSTAGTVRIEDEGEGVRRIKNDSELELRDAVLVDLSAEDSKRERRLGTIAAGGTVVLSPETAEEAAGEPEAPSAPDPTPILNELRRNWEATEENKGELRLVAWAAKPAAGQTIEPPVDRLRGFTAVIVHLRVGSPPSPDAKAYNLLADTETELDLRSDGQLNRRSRPPAGRRAPGTPQKAQRPRSVIQ